MPRLLIAGLMLVGALVPTAAQGDVQEVSLDDLESLARLSFSIGPGRCRANAGPDGHSVRLTCPASPDDVQRIVAGSMSGSAVRVTVEQSAEAVEVELSLPTPLAGYHLSHRRRRVVIDVGRRTWRTELTRVRDEVRFSLAEEGDHEFFAELDQLLEQRDVAGARAHLTEAPHEKRPELAGLRGGDVELLDGNLDAAGDRYGSIAMQYTGRSAGKLAALRLSELHALQRGLAMQDELPELPPMEPRHDRATAQAWLVAARLARWRRDHDEAIRLASALDRPDVDDAVLERALALRDESLAALVLDASRQRDHVAICKTALRHQKALLGHPALEALAGPAHGALKRMALPEDAAKVLQSLVEASNSDALVVSTAPELSEAYLRAGKVYRASQVVEYALAVSGGGKSAPELWVLKSRIAVVEGRGRDALASIERAEKAPPLETLRAAMAALRDGDVARAAARLDALAEINPRAFRREIELARAEAHALAHQEDASDLLAMAVLGAAPDDRIARLSYIRAEALERAGDLRAAEKVYRGVAGDERWERLAKVGATAAHMAAEVASATAEANKARPAAPPAPAEAPSKIEGSGAEGDAAAPDGEERGGEAEPPTADTESESEPPPSEAESDAEAGPEESDDDDEAAAEAEASGEDS